MTCVKTITHCRVCGKTELEDVYSFGSQYVSDFVDPAARASGNWQGLQCPLDLIVCHHCGLVQLRHTAPSELLYRRHYWYRSGTTATMRAALRDVTRAVEARVNLQPSDVVLDLGSNDGTLLRSYSKPCFKIGVEPANNLHKEGEVGLDHLVQDFWSANTYPHSEKAKVITACGMLYDLDEPNQFIGDVAKTLAPDGLFVVQLMGLKQMLAAKDVGNLAHEHLEFYPLVTLEYLFGAHGLGIDEVEENSVNGGSYRLYVKHRDQVTQFSFSRALAYREEFDRGLPGVRPWTVTTLQDEFKSWERNRDACVTFLQEEVAKGKKVWVYGASTKGNVILQWYGLDRSIIQGAVDKDPWKWGLETVGTWIPIRNEFVGRERADYFLILPYAFLEEFKAREADWRKGGGKFVVPLPTFQVI